MVRCHALAGEQELPGLTDEEKPRLRGPKRASKIRKLFNLTKDDDVRKYVNTYRKVRSQISPPPQPFSAQAVMLQPWNLCTQCSYRICCARCAWPGSFFMQSRQPSKGPSCLVAGEGEQRQDALQGAEDPAAGDAAHAAAQAPAELYEARAHLKGAHAIACMMTKLSWHITACD